jgi:hypothetical protein
MAPNIPNPEEKDLTKEENLGKMTEGYAKMLKFISVRQDISSVKNEAKQLAEKLRAGRYLHFKDHENLTNSNVVYALLDYIESLEEEISMLRERG